MAATETGAHGRISTANPASGLSCRTARLDLAPFRASDSAALLRVFTDSDVRRYLLDGDTVSTDWVAEEIRASTRRFEAGAGGLWVVRRRDQAPIIGFAGFREFFDPPEPQLLYGLLPQYWGEGLATEAATAACEFAFHTLGWSEIRAAIDVPNTASRSVLVRLGFVPDRTTDDGTAFYVLGRDAARLQVVGGFATGT
ncbi:MAG: GNAT family N-acetyltransferase [Acidobacteria bacterium]|nr:GNAT family N-acetyltransferase [Acidobacteriota bacterium]